MCENLIFPKKCVKTDFLKKSCSDLIFSIFPFFPIFPHFFHFFSIFSNFSTFFPNFQNAPQIGSVYYEVREEQLRRSFGPFGPIKLCNMSLDPLTGKHKGFAFLEFEMPEASQLAIEQMNGVLLGGRAIKIGRPTNMPQSMPIVEQLVRDSQKSNRIYKVVLQKCPKSENC